jgi:hypothetical protein
LEQMMSETLIEFFQVLSGAMPALLAGLLFVALVRTQLVKFMGVYLLLVAGQAVATYLLMPTVSFIVPLTIGAAGALLSIVLIGLLGARIGVANTQTAFVALGLFPWYLGVGPAIVYVVVSALALAFWATVTTSRAFARGGHRRVSLKRAKAEMSASDYEVFSKRAAVVFALPVLVGALAAAGAAAF